VIFSAPWREIFSSRWRGPGANEDWSWGAWCAPQPDRDRCRPAHSHGPNDLASYVYRGPVSGVRVRVVDSDGRNTCYGALLVMETNALDPKWATVCAGQHRS
jgi:hypothetical protein